MKKSIMLLVTIIVLFSLSLTSCQKVDVGPKGAKVPINASINSAIVYKADLLNAINIGEKMFPNYDAFGNPNGVISYGEFYSLKVYIDLGFFSNGRVKQSDEPITVIVRSDDVIRLRSIALENNMIRTGLGKTTFPDGKVSDIIYLIY